MPSCKNVGPVDRGIRALVGIAAITLAFTKFHALDGSIAGVVALGAGAIMLITAAIGICPLYFPLKLSTCATTK